MTLSSVDIRFVMATVIRHSSSAPFSRNTGVVNTQDYAAVRARVTVLVLEGDPEMPVPACPGWRVRDVVGHLAGLCEDLSLIHI